MTDDATDTDARTDPSGDPSDQVGYAGAIAELDEILHDLERADVDVDVLAEKVARAAELIALCRARISAARLQVEQVVADLGAPADG